MKAIGAYLKEGTGTAAAEIDIAGSGASIVSGDATPSLLDDTQFGSVVVSTGSPVAHTFIISNAGSATLNLTGAPLVSVTGTDFTVTAVPTTPVLVGGSTTFEITFDPHHQR